MRRQAGTAESTELVAEYERLRANALGAANRSRGLAVLMRHGMAAWIGFLIHPEPVPSAGMGDGFQSAAGHGTHVDGSAAAVLADAILGMTRTATGARP